MVVVGVRLLKMRMSRLGASNKNTRIQNTCNKLTAILTHATNSHLTQLRSSSVSEAHNLNQGRDEWLDRRKT